MRGRGARKHSQQDQGKQSSKRKSGEKGGRASVNVTRDVEETPREDAQVASTWDDGESKDETGNNVEGTTQSAGLPNPQYAYLELVLTKNLSKLPGECPENAVRETQLIKFDMVQDKVLDVCNWEWLEDAV
eukprot:1567202-Rhodomonas_salina.1